MTAYFAFEEDFKLPATSLGGELIPIVAYLDYDSRHCIRECRQEVLKARAVDPMYNRYHLQSFSIYHTATRADYCNFLVDELDENQGNPLHPSPTSYFAYVGANQTIGTVNGTCDDGVADQPKCANIEVKHACTRNSTVGAEVRADCRATCDTCDAESTWEDAIDWRALQRKHTCITYHLHTGKNDASYEMHDMVCRPPKATFALQGDLTNYSYRNGDLPLLEMLCCNVVEVSSRGCPQQ